jgi:hypothetical protein
MSELSGRDLLEEWRGVMESLLASAGAATGRSEMPRELLGAMRRQLELMQEVIDREQQVQRELASRVVAPFDAIFDLLEQTGGALRGQAEALASAGQALQDTARLVESQADLFERTIGVLRQPTELAKSAAGLPRRAPKGKGDS